MTPEDDLLICAMSKACAHEDCAHRYTHKFGHLSCKTRYSEYVKETRFCSSFKIRPVLRGLPFLSNEKSITYLHPSKLSFGVCCPWKYWKKHMELNAYHVLLHTVSVLDLTRNGTFSEESNKIRATLYQKLWKETDKSGWTSVYKSNFSTPSEPPVTMRISEPPVRSMTVEEINNRLRLILNDERR